MKSAARVKIAMTSSPANITRFGHDLTIGSLTGFSPTNQKRPSIGGSLRILLDYHTTTGVR